MKYTKKLELFQCPPADALAFLAQSRIPLRLLRHVDTQQDEYGAEESDVGDGLVEHGNRAEERDEGLGVHIVGGTDGAKLLKHEIPRIETEHGGYYREEEHIACHDRDSEQV